MEKEFDGTTKTVGCLCIAAIALNALAMWSLYFATTGQGWPW